jgi:hypothetical protein
MGMQLSWLSWRDEKFGTVAVSNCLDYLSRSPFVEGADPASVRESYSSKKLVLRDAEYVLQDVQPPHLFVIRKQSPTRSTTASLPLGLFYILDGVVHAAPSLGDVVSARRRRCGFRIHESLELLRGDLNPVSGVLANRPADMATTIANLESVDERNMKDRKGNKDETEKSAAAAWKGDDIIGQFFHN